MPISQLSLKGRALRLLGMREHSRLELERKLKSHEAEPGLLSKALDELQAKGFIDERRVVESVIHRRSAKLGAARIRQELQTKGLDAAVVQGAIASLQSTELARARAIWRKRFGASALADGAGNNLDKAGTARERGKQMRFLLSRGFGGDTVRRVVAQMDEDQDFLPD